MLGVARLLPLLAAAFTTIADGPSSAPPGTPTPNASVPAAPAPGAAAPSAPAPDTSTQSVPVPVLVGENEIRTAFAGKAACPPGEPGVGVGPWEFHADGNYLRQQDLASAHGRYAIANGKICVTLVDSDKVDFCLAVMKQGDNYLFRLDDSSDAASRRAAVPVSPCPLPPP